MPKYKKMSDEDILTALKSNIDDGVGFWDDKLSKERQRVLNYYHGALPLPVHGGNSKYVSQDVYDSVESMKASLLETFSAGYNIVEFTPQDANDTRGARIASLYTDYVIFRQNNGYEVFSDVITDGLLARNGVVKVYWDKDVTEVEETFDSVSPDEADAMLSKEDVSDVGDLIQNEDGTVSGSLTRKVDRSQVRFEAIPPEEFMISSIAKKPNSNFMAHRLTKTASELKKMGLTQAQIDTIPSDQDIQKDVESYARTQDVSGTSYTLNNINDYQDQVRHIRVHECYIMLDVEGTGIAKLWKVTRAGDIMVDKEQVDDHPFLFFVPLPIPHTFFGSNFATKVIPTQNARSILIRGILDHTVITNNPRTMVVKGALINPKEMLENRVGGVVNVTRPDGVFPYPQSSLNPFVFQTIGLLDADKEDTTGTSKLSQGLNKDAISTQNSEGLVENLVGLSQQRQKIIARNFANSFLIPLYLKVYKIVLENEKKKKILDLAGDWIEVDVEQWTERSEVYSTLKLGYGEQGKEAGKLLQFHQLMSNDPTLGPMYPIAKRYNVLRAMVEKEGVKNVADYMVQPGSPEWKDPQPDPKMTAEIAVLNQKVAASQMETQMLQLKVTHAAQIADAKAEADKKQAMIDLLLSQREQERKDYETKNRAAVAQGELAIIEKSTPEKTNQSNIVSPNG